MEITSDQLCNKAIRVIFYDTTISLWFDNTQRNKMYSFNNWYIFINEVHDIYRNTHDRSSLLISKC